MADLVVTNPNVANGVVPTSNAVSVSDRFAVTQGRKYLLRVNNAGGTINNVTIDDPNSQLPVGGSGTPASFADVVLPVAIGTVRSHIVDASRHADASGWVNLTASFTTTNTYEIYGPL